MSTPVQPSPPEPKPEAPESHEARSEKVRAVRDEARRKASSDARQRMKVEENARLLRSAMSTISTTREIYGELNTIAKSLQNVARKCQSLELDLRRNQEVQLSHRISARTLCSAVFGSTQMVQSVLRLVGRLDSAERDLQEELK